MSRIPWSFTFASVFLIGVFARPSTGVAFPPPPPPSLPLELFNPDWSITLTDFGYSDLLFDQRPGFEGREYLSGEWGAAVRYDLVGGGTTAGSPTWVEPDFLFPDWTTNSNFSPTISQTVLTSDAFGLGLDNSSTSTVSNGQLEIKQTYTMIDTGSGVKQGQVPKGAVSPGLASLSNRYILKQTYEFKNVSSQEMTGLKLFQFLHGLNSEIALYDDRAYSGAAFDSFKYDISMFGESTEFGGGGFLPFTEFEEGHYLFDDNLTFHSEVAPDIWEVGHYGKQTVDDHETTGKPSVGVHLSIEADSLSGIDFFDPSPPDNLWVSGAQRFSLPTLASSETASFEILLTISTEQEFIGPIVPEPSTFVLFGTGAIGLLLFRRRRTS